MALGLVVLATLWLRKILPLCCLKHSCHNGDETSDTIEATEAEDSGYDQYQSEGDCELQRPLLKNEHVMTLLTTDNNVENRSKRTLIHYCDGEIEDEKEEEEYGTSKRRECDTDDDSKTERLLTTGGIEVLTASFLSRLR